MTLGYCWYRALAGRWRKGAVAGRRAGDGDAARYAVPRARETHAIMPRGELAIGQRPPREKRAKCSAPPRGRAAGRRAAASRTGWVARAVPGPHPRTAAGRAARGARARGADGLSKARTAMCSAPSGMGLCRTDEATEPALERARDAESGLGRRGGRGGGGGGGGAAPCPTARGHGAARIAAG